MKFLPGIVIARREPTRDRSYTPTFTGRVPEKIAPKPSPPPPRESQVWNIGRTYEHAYPHQWVTVDLSIDEKLSIMEPNGFKFPTVPSAMVMRPAMGYNNANPLVSRVNIVSPKNQAYGSIAEAAPGIPYSPSYAKLV